MKFSLKISKIDHILLYILITALILMSGSIIGWANSYVLYVELTAFIIFIMLKVNFHEKIMAEKRNLITFVFILFVFLFNYIVISNLDFWSQKSFFLNLCVAYICTLYVSYEEYTKNYINIMVFLSTMNLIFYGLHLLGIRFGTLILSYDGGASYQMNLFCIYAIKYSNSNSWWIPVVRNFGIFWEPGCYQAFLNLALFFFLNNVRKNWYKDKKSLFSFVVLVTTIISTLSTSAFFLLIINLIIYYWKNLQHLTKRKFFIGVGILVIIIFMLQSSVVMDKFTSGTSSYVSYQIRANDQLSGIKACFYSPIFGMGHGTKLYNTVLMEYGIEGNSSGVLRIIQEFGIFFGVWFITKQWRTVIIYKKRKNAGIIPESLSCLFLFIMFSTEPIIYNPAFMILIYTLKSEHEYLKLKDSYN